MSNVILKGDWRERNLIGCGMRCFRNCEGGESGMPCTVTKYSSMGTHCQRMLLASELQPQFSRGKNVKGKYGYLLFFFLYTAFKTTFAAVPMLVYANSIAISSESPVNFAKHVVILAVFYCHRDAQFLLRHLENMGRICTHN